MANATKKTAKKTALVSAEELAHAFASALLTAKQCGEQRPDLVTIDVHSTTSSLPKLFVDHGEGSGSTSVMYEDIFGKNLQSIHIEFPRGDGSSRRQFDDMFSLDLGCEMGPYYDLNYIGFRFTTLARFDPELRTAHFPAGIGAKRQQRALAILKAMEDRFRGLMQDD